MKTALPPIVFLLLQSLALAADFRLAEATKPDWRGEAGLVFATETATVAIEGDGGTVPRASLSRSPGGQWADAQLLPDGANRWLLNLTERGWYDCKVGDLTFTAAVLGAPIPEQWRTNSVFGIWNVHGDTALIRLAGARWNRRMTSFRDVTEEEAEMYGGASSPTNALPYEERDGLAQIGVFSFGMPLWTMDMPDGIKLPSFGNPFYPAKDWNAVSHAVAAYARTHSLPLDMSIYNEPLAHFKGKPEQIADYARAVRAGLKAADPSFRVGGPGLYSIHIANLSKIESAGLLETLDFLDMHAYVGGTPPEEEFIRKIDMLKDWLAAHGRADMPVCLSEFGWTAALGTWQPPVDRATQARYVARSLALAWSRGIDALIYFALDFRNKKAGEAAFSLIGPDGRPEAGYCAFAAVSRHFAASEPLGHSVLAPGVHMATGRREGRLQLMLWCEDNVKPFDIAPAFGFASARDLFGTPIPAGALLRISPSPIFLETGIVTDAEIEALPSKIAAALPRTIETTDDATGSKEEQPPLEIWSKGAKDGAIVPASRWKSFGGVFNLSDGAPESRLEYDADGLYLTVGLQDFDHLQTMIVDDPSLMWSQDSLQLGIDMDADKPWEAGFAGAENSQTFGGHRVFEFTFGADGNGGGKAFLEQSWDDSLPMGTVRERIKVETDMLSGGIPWRYRIFIPWVELGAAGKPPKPGDEIGVALAVNDIDPGQGTPRHGWTLFGGIVHDKDPKLFGRAVLRGSGDLW